MLKALRGRGAVLIAAAGNAGPNSRPLYPAANPDVIAVTATDPEDMPFAQANRGPHIAVAAPGVNILAAAPNAGYQMQSGTSFAAAQVSGIAALLLERNPKLDAASIRSILMSTARDLGAPGHDDQFGSGLADALDAVLSASPKSSEASGSAAVSGN
jgi:subtilisin family serine protease